MAKLGVINYNWPGFSFEQFLRFVADNGVQYVELFSSLVMDDENDSHSERKAEGVRKQVESFGLQVGAVGAGNDFVQLEESEIGREVARMKRVCEVAKILGEDVVIRSEGGAPKDSVAPERYLEAMHGCFSRCVEFAEALPINIAIDNHGVITNDGDLLYELIQKIGSPRIGTALDTMNYRWKGNSLETCDRFYQIMAPHVMYVHLKDGFDSLENYRGAALGEGEIHLQHALDCLRKAGYNGVYAAEYEGPEAEGGVGYAKCFQWMKENI